MKENGNLVILGNFQGLPKLMRFLGGKDEKSTETGAEIRPRP